MSDTAGVIDHITVADEVLGKAAVTKLDFVRDADLMAASVRLARARRLLDATDAHLLAELDARNVTLIAEGKTTAHWYAEQAGIPKGAASRRVRVSNKLRAPLSRVDEALAHGLISWDHAAIIAGVANPRIVDDIAAIQDQLIGLVGGATFERFTAEVRGIAEQLDEDGGHDPRDDDNTNEVHLDTLPDGTHLSGRLVGDIEQSVLSAIEAETDRLFRKFRTDHDNSNGDIDIPKRSTLRAMALAELCRRARGVDQMSTKAPVPDVTLVIHGDDPFAAFTTAGQRLSDAAAAVLCCDPNIHTLLTNSLGVPLDLGHAVRYANQAQRRALHQRDGGCVFPGCDAHPNWTDAHHVIPWLPDSTGGPTDMNNLALMCRRHHRIIHRRGWTMTATDDQWFTFTTPHSQTLQSQRHGHQQAGHQQAGPAPPD